MYVEPFGGAASVLLRKPRSYAEVYNDLYGDVVGLFRVLRDPATAGELERRLRLTPFARDELAWAFQPATDPIDSAHRMIIRSFMGFGATGVMGHLTGFRSNVHRRYTTPAADWSRFPDQVQLFTERLTGVVIENREAMQVVQGHDAETTLHYVDPPYVHSTRSLGNPHCAKHRYAFEMDEQAHRSMAEVLQGLKGMVVLSGYPSVLYERLYRGWSRIERQSRADGARPRTEVLWLNPACARSLSAA